MSFHHCRFALALTGILFLLPAAQRGTAAAQDKKTPPNATADLAARPITSIPGEAGDLLRRWWKEGTAAGNVGDLYDNRDGGHSPLDLNLFPQLRQIDYSNADKKLGKHWAAQRVIVPGVAFGNSSTSAPFHLGGSNVRMYYTHPRGLEFLYQQYIRNNLYIYPEHQDHDPGHNGAGNGHGDAYPTNTPFLITSQGSSGSDQPFMRAVPMTLAAFRPEVKKQLAKTGFLMPTVQMILRASSKQLKAPADYLTSKAHPTVFEGSLVDDLKMVKMAHGIRLESIPPAVQLHVATEETPLLGRDFFEPEGTSEKLADTPAVIARIFRGKDLARRIVVSAEKSIDLNKRPLKYRWVLLRGDPDRVRIKPLGDGAARAEIVIEYQERRPIGPGSPTESNRIDVGVFAHNGDYYSAPAFITYYTLDHEARIYDKSGKVVEIGYGLGESRASVTDWKRAVELAASTSPAARLLPLPASGRTELAGELPTFRKLQAGLAKANDRRNALAKNKKDHPELIAADKALAAARKAVDAFLDRPLPKSKKSPRQAIEDAFRELVRDVRLGDRHAAMLVELLARANKPAKLAVETAIRRLVDLGLAAPGSSSPLRLADGPLSAYRRSMIERYNVELLSRLVYPEIITATFIVNYVDPRISAARTWRDVYRYDAAGKFAGWQRYSPGKITEFNADGHAILKKDALGRCIEAGAVRYLREPARRPGGNINPLRQVPGGEVFTYEYAGDTDRHGKRGPASPALWQKPSGGPCPQQR